MATRKKKKPQHPLAFVTTVGVRLNERDMADLAECAEREGKLRNEVVHESTLLRELGMPVVRARLAELRQPVVRSDEDRRSGEERRAPATVGL